MHLVHPEPLVSCLMPTYNRRAYISAAIDCFLRQDYPHLELVILDDGSDPVEDLVPADGRFRYVRQAERMVGGPKRNRTCELARGEILAHWDDDDWHSPNYLSCEVETLLETGVEAVGLDRVLYYDLVNDQGYQFFYPGWNRSLPVDGTLVYRRSLWNRGGFQDIPTGAESRFVRSIPPERLGVLSIENLYVGLIHPSNSSPKKTSGTYWRPYPVEAIRRITGPTWPN